MLCCRALPPCVWSKVHDLSSASLQLYKTLLGNGVVYRDKCSCALVACGQVCWLAEQGLGFEGMQGDQRELRQHTLLQTYAKQRRRITQRCCVERNATMPTRLLAIDQPCKSNQHVWCTRKVLLINVRHGYCSCTFAILVTVSGATGS